MKLDRLEVSGGFLDGLRLDFSNGLNVLIGARGAGKTSVLELARFVLGVKAMTAEAEAEAGRQARAVLGDGTVSLYCSVQGQDLVFTRTGLDDAPTASAAFVYEPPLIVSQSEIEAIGLDPASRREILDRLIEPLAWNEIGTPEGRSPLASLERRLERLRHERDEFLDHVSRSDGLDAQLKEAAQEQLKAAAMIASAEPLQQSIANLADHLGQVRSAADAYKIADETLAEWARGLSESRLARPIPRLPSPDVHDEVSASIGSARALIDQSVAEIERAQKLVSASRAEAIAEQVSIQASLKSEAEKLEELQKGAGEVGRRVSALRQQLQEREGLLERIRELDAEITSVLSERDAALDAADEQAEARYRLRKRRAAELTKEFNGRIEIRVDKSGEFATYESALISALQGSNLQYKALAADIAGKMSPRELVAAVEAADPDRIVKATGITVDRAARLVVHLAEQSRAAILLAPLEDSVDFALLDGQDYKVTSRLSMGQRCTVVLPLLLAGEREAILLDQPEDHLDNAFIVETLVAAVRDRALTGQTIVATHNANIPVLGDARLVVVLASDGRRGFVTSAASLEDQVTVEAITTLMEGGREAFSRRAAFYDEHDHVG
jgi:DNA repair ATPase RecN